MTLYRHISTGFLSLAGESLPYFQSILIFLYRTQSSEVRPTYEDYNKVEKETGFLEPQNKCRTQDESNNNHKNDCQGEDNKTKPDKPRPEKESLGSNFPAIETANHKGPLPQHSQQDFYDVLYNDLDVSSKETTNIQNSTEDVCDVLYEDLDPGDKETNEIQKSTGELPAKENVCGKTSKDKERKDKGKLNTTHSREDISDVLYCDLNKEPKGSEKSLTEKISSKEDQRKDDVCVVLYDDLDEEPNECHENEKSTKELRSCTEKTENSIVEINNIQKSPTKPISSQKKDKEDSSKPTNSDIYVDLSNNLEKIRTSPKPTTTSHITRKINTPHKVAIFQTLFGPSPSTSEGSNITPKSISNKIPQSDSKTTSPSEYSDFEIEEMRTPNYDNNDLDSCFISNEYKTAAGKIIDLTEQEETCNKEKVINSSHAASHIQIPGLDLLMVTMAKDMFDTSKKLEELSFLRLSKEGAESINKSLDITSKVGESVPDIHEGKENKLTNVEEQGCCSIAKQDTSSTSLNITPKARESVDDLHEEKENKLTNEEEECLSIDKLDTIGNKSLNITSKVVEAVKHHGGNANTPTNEDESCSRYKETISSPMREEEISFLDMSKQDTVSNKSLNITSNVVVLDKDHGDRNIDDDKCATSKKNISSVLIEDELTNITSKDVTTNKDHDKRNVATKECSSSAQKISCPLSDDEISFLNITSKIVESSKEYCERNIDDNKCSTSLKTISSDLEEEELTTKKSLNITSKMVESYKEIEGNETTQAIEDEECHNSKKTISCSISEENISLIDISTERSTTNITSNNIHSNIEPEKESDTHKEGTNSKENISTPLSSKDSSFHGILPKDICCDITSKDAATHKAHGEGIIKCSTSEKNILFPLRVKDRSFLGILQKDTTTNVCNITSKDIHTTAGQEIENMQSMGEEVSSSPMKNISFAKICQTPPKIIPCLDITSPETASIVIQDVTTPKRSTKSTFKELTPKSKMLLLQCDETLGSSLESEQTLSRDSLESELTKPASESSMEPLNINEDDSGEMRKFKECVQGNDENIKSTSPEKYQEGLKGVTPLPNILDVDANVAEIIKENETTTKNVSLAKESVKCVTNFMVMSTGTSNECGPNPQTLDKGECSLKAYSDGEDMLASKLVDDKFAHEESDLTTKVNDMESASKLHPPDNDTNFEETSEGKEHLASNSLKQLFNSGQSNSKATPSQRSEELNLLSNYSEPLLICEDPDLCKTEVKNSPKMRNTLVETLDIASKSAGTGLSCEESKDADYSKPNCTPITTSKTSEEKEFCCTPLNVVLNCEKSKTEVFPSKNISPLEASKTCKESGLPSMCAEESEVTDPIIQRGPSTETLKSPEDLVLPSESFEPVLNCEKTRLAEAMATDTPTSCCHKPSKSSTDMESGDTSSKQNSSTCSSLDLTWSEGTPEKDTTSVEHNTDALNDSYTKVSNKEDSRKDMGENENSKKSPEISKSNNFDSDHKNSIRDRNSSTDLDSSVIVIDDEEDSDPKMSKESLNNNKDLPVDSASHNKSEIFDLGDESMSEELPPSISDCNEQKTKDQDCNMEEKENAESLTEEEPKSSGENSEAFESFPKETNNNCFETHSKIKSKETKSSEHPKCLESKNNVDEREENIQNNSVSVEEKNCKQSPFVKDNLAIETKSSEALESLEIREESYKENPDSHMEKNFKETSIGEQNLALEVESIDNVTSEKKSAIKDSSSKEPSYNASERAPSPLVEDHQQLSPQPEDTIKVMTSENIEKVIEIHASSSKPTSERILSSPTKDKGIAMPLENMEKASIESVVVNEKLSSNHPKSAEENNDEPKPCPGEVDTQSVEVLSFGCEDERMTMTSHEFAKESLSSKDSKPAKLISEESDQEMSCPIENSQASVESVGNKTLSSTTSAPMPQNKSHSSTSSSEEYKSKAASSSDATCRDIDQETTTTTGKDSKLCKNLEEEDLQMREVAKEAIVYNLKTSTQLLHEQSIGEMSGANIYHKEANKGGDVTISLESNEGLLIKETVSASHEDTPSEPTKDIEDVEKQTVISLIPEEDQEEPALEFGNTNGRCKSLEEMSLETSNKAIESSTDGVAQCPDVKSTEKLVWETSDNEDNVDTSLECSEIPLEAPNKAIKISTEYTTHSPDVKSTEKLVIEISDNEDNMDTSLEGSEISSNKAPLKSVEEKNLEVKEKTTFPPAPLATNEKGNMREGLADNQQLNTNEASVSILAKDTHPTSGPCSSIVPKALNAISGSSHSPEETNPTSQEASTTDGVCSIVSKDTCTATDKSSSPNPVKLKTTSCQNMSGAEAIKTKSGSKGNSTSKPSKEEHTKETNNLASPLRSHHKGNEESLVECEKSNENLASLHTSQTTDETTDTVSKGTYATTEHYTCSPRSLATIDQNSSLVSTDSYVPTIQTTMKSSKETCSPSHAQPNTNTCQNVADSQAGPKDQTLLEPTTEIDLEDAENAKNCSASLEYFEKGDGKSFLVLKGHMETQQLQGTESSKAGANINSSKDAYTTTEHDNCTPSNVKRKIDVNFAIPQSEVRSASNETSKHDKTSSRPEFDIQSACEYKQEAERIQISSTIGNTLKVQTTCKTQQQPQGTKVSNTIGNAANIPSPCKTKQQQQRINTSGSIIKTLKIQSPHTTTNEQQQLSPFKTNPTNSYTHSKTSLQQQQQRIIINTAHDSTNTLKTLSINDCYNAPIVLPSISTTCPTPSNFSGIFSRNNSIQEDANTTNLNAQKTLSPPTKEYVLPAASVLCTMDNLKDVTKATTTAAATPCNLINKKLHWELLKENKETIEIEDDSDADSSDEEKKLKIMEEEEELEENRGGDARDKQEDIEDPKKTQNVTCLRHGNLNHEENGGELDAKNKHDHDSTEEDPQKTPEILTPESKALLTTSPNPEFVDKIIKSRCQVTSKTNNTKTCSPIRVRSAEKLMDKAILKVAMIKKKKLTLCLSPKTKCGRVTKKKVNMNSKQRKPKAKGVTNSVDEDSQDSPNTLGDILSSSMQKKLVLDNMVNEVVAQQTNKYEVTRSPQENAVNQKRLAVHTSKSLVENASHIQSPVLKPSSNISSFINQATSKMSDISETLKKIGEELTTSNVGNLSMTENEPMKPILTLGPANSIKLSPNSSSSPTPLNPQHGPKKVVDVNTFIMHATSNITDISKTIDKIKEVTASKVGKPLIMAAENRSPLSCRTVSSPTTFGLHNVSQNVHTPNYIVTTPTNHIPKSTQTKPPTTPMTKSVFIRNYKIPKIKKPSTTVNESPTDSSGGEKNNSVGAADKANKMQNYLATLQNILNNKAVPHTWNVNYNTNPAATQQCTASETTIKSEVMEKESHRKLLNITREFSEMKESSSSSTSKPLTKVRRKSMYAQVGDSDTNSNAVAESVADVKPFENQILMTTKPIRPYNKLRYIEVYDANPSPNDGSLLENQRDDDKELKKTKANPIKSRRKSMFAETNSQREIDRPLKKSNEKPAHDSISSFSSSFNAGVTSSLSKYNERPIHGIRNEGVKHELGEVIKMPLKSRRKSMLAEANESISSSSSFNVASHDFKQNENMRSEGAKEAENNSLLVKGVKKPPKSRRKSMFAEGYDTTSTSSFKGENHEIRDTTDRSVTPLGANVAIMEGQISREIDLQAKSKEKSSKPMTKEEQIEQMSSQIPDENTLEVIKNKEVPPKTEKNPVKARRKSVYVAFDYKNSSQDSALTNLGGDTSGMSLKATEEKGLYYSQGQVGEISDKSLLGNQDEVALATGYPKETVIHTKSDVTNPHSTAEEGQLDKIPLENPTEKTMEVVGKKEGVPKPEKKPVKARRKSLYIETDGKNSAKVPLDEVLGGDQNEKTIEHIDNKDVTTKAEKKPTKTRRKSIYIEADSNCSSQGSLDKIPVSDQSEKSMGDIDNKETQTTTEKNATKSRRKSVYIETGGNYSSEGPLENDFKGDETVNSMEVAENKETQPIHENKPTKSRRKSVYSETDGNYSSQGYLQKGFESDRNDSTMEVTENKEAQHIPNKKPTKSRRKSVYVEAAGDNASKEIVEKGLSENQSEKSMQVIENRKPKDDDNPQAIPKKKPMKSRRISIYYDFDNAGSAGNQSEKPLEDTMKLDIEETKAIEGRTTSSISVDDKLHGSHVAGHHIEDVYTENQALEVVDKETADTTDKKPPKARRRSLYYEMEATSEINDSPVSREQSETTREKQSLEAIAKEKPLQDSKEIKTEEKGKKEGASVTQDNKSVKKPAKVRRKSIYQEMDVTNENPNESNLKNPDTLERNEISTTMKASKSATSKRRKSLYIEDLGDLEAASGIVTEPKVNIEKPSKGRRKSISVDKKELTKANVGESMKTLSAKSIQNGPKSMLLDAADSDNSTSTRGDNLAVDHKNEKEVKDNQTTITIKRRRKSMHAEVVKGSFLLEESGQEISTKLQEKEEVGDVIHQTDETIKKNTSNVSTSGTLRSRSKSLYNETPFFDNQPQTVGEHKKPLNIHRRILDSSSDEADSSSNSSSLIHILPIKPVIQNVEIITPPPAKKRCTTTTTVRKRRVVKILSSSYQTDQPQQRVEPEPTPTPPPPSPSKEDKQDFSAAAATTNNNDEPVEKSCLSMLNTHPIFNTQVQNELLAEPNPNNMTPSLLHDDRFKEIDSTMQDMFNSPQHEPQSLNESKSNVLLDEMTTTMANKGSNTNDSNDSGSTNITTTTASVTSTPPTSAVSTHNTSDSTKHVTLGTSEYRFEKTNDNVVTMFISRKRKRKQN
ncbi:FLICE-associated huge protein isoform X2 [Musca autumnalis]|uniref:FLICE-associated huge protein isoform X2 n=1 Tax=Musca autumnalis TaxID=221902 RepID=UPI003CF619A6